MGTTQLPTMNFFQNTSSHHLCKYVSHYHLANFRKLLQVHLRTRSFWAQGQFSSKSSQSLSFFSWTDLQQLQTIVNCKYDEPMLTIKSCRNKDILHKIQQGHLFPTKILQPKNIQSSNQKALDWILRKTVSIRT